ncbi:MAG: tRNA epoxyqueuosine(34) reductase QueG [Betaproteobacteria bacterium]|nr:tRNA epoxyqueuosine(34) reductase QueG [Betaproteobacteria bacterium]
MKDFTERIRNLAAELGFSACGIVPLHSEAQVKAVERFADWVEAGFGGEMDYMARGVNLRREPEMLLPEARSVICVTMDYWPEAGMREAIVALADPAAAYISRYALGRDYHKTMRQRLKALVSRLEELDSEARWRVFSDSAPVLEVEHARQGGLGWRGKNTLLLSQRGSWHFLGEIYTTLSLPLTVHSKAEESGHCGSCEKCRHACPTGAIIAPYKLDARRCVSYLTIELKGSIPEELRPLIGNRVYGCDDCQLVCPWNRQPPPGNADFSPRNALSAAKLVELMAWEEADFLERLEGSAIRRIGHIRWLRNLAVALGNGEPTPEARAALTARLNHPAELVREHVAWALAQLDKRHTDGNDSADGNFP